MAMALPASLLVAPSFHPYEHRTSLEGRDVRITFALPSREWLFFETELTVRDPDGTRPPVVVSIDDVEVARLRPRSLYAAEWSRTLVPVQLAPGEHTLHVRVEGARDTTFAMQARLQNYRGINRAFPRLAVVPVQAFRSAIAERGVGRQLGLFALAWPASALLVWAVTLAAQRVGSPNAVPILMPPMVVLWGALLYGALTPLSVWLSIEALATITCGLALVALAGLAARRHQRVIGRLAFSAVLTLALAEAGLRALNWMRPTSIFYSETSARYRGRPGAPFLDGRLNGGGFNDVDRTRERPAGVYRIVAIGDSVAFGVVPREQNYLALLERELSRTRPTEVINMGVPGTSPREYLALLMEEGLAFSPQLVLVGFFIGNDFETRARKWYEYSFAVTLVNFAWRIATAGAPDIMRFESDAEVYRDDQPTFGWDRFLEIQVSRSAIFRTDAAMDDQVNEAVRILREMRDLCGSAGAEMVVVIVPDEVQVDGTLQDHVVRASGIPRGQFDFAQPNRRLADALSAEDIESIDLLPAIAARAVETRVYKPQDTHWNLEGNRVAAEALARALQQRTGG
jgi:lysophospholipase L1-like esterase